MDRLDLENTDFHQKVRDAYLNLAREDQSGRWIVVDANQKREVVEEAVWQAIQVRLKLTKVKTHD